MEKHYASRQKYVYDAIKAYYAEHMNVVCEEGEALLTDISYDGSWMKRGHTSKIGMGVIIEVCTGFIVDFEVLSKGCALCSHKENLLDEQKITEDEFMVWKILHDENCAKNYEGTSGGMEAKGAEIMFGRSESL